MKHFYGQAIDPNVEQEKIQKILSKYRQEEVTEDLKKRIYEELMQAKFEGKILIPFKVVMRKGNEHHPAVIEIILDTKV